MKHIKPIEELTFVDDYMFGFILQNEKICKELLERLLKIKIEKVVYPELQKSISPYYETKGVRLDVYVKDSNRVFDIEIQNSKNIDLPKRTRYYQSMIDIDSLLKGESYSELKESIIIFICTFDPFGENLPCYTFKNLCIENIQLELNDQAVKKIYNSTAYMRESDVEISAFLEYINTRTPTDDFTKKLSHLVEEAKLNNIFRDKYLTMNIHDQDITKEAYEEGLSAGLQQGLQQGIQQGETRGLQQGKYEAALNMLNRNLPIEIVCECTGLSKDVIENIKKETKQHFSG
ncbi:MAG: Rpn family recombination-promoting nuclease/putative transposase [Spirochaetaceae bacterium]|nr:Rpn family recombination-promoting nuclease/putative transposase [Spirochaetaceae bacterium]